jgi:hypothetical protein
MVEMGIPREKNQTVLHHQGRDPEIVGRDRSPLTTQLGEEGRIVVGRLLVRKEYSNPGRVQESDQHLLILPRTGSHLKPSA